MSSILSRRSFALGSAAFAGLALTSCASGGVRSAARVGAAAGYGPLIPDPAGILDLPRGFSYRIISRFGDRMDDGHFVPSRADGMGAFRLDGRRLALVRNHELRPQNRDEGPFRDRPASPIHERTPRETDRPIAINPIGPPLPTGFDATNGVPLPGGTTTIVYDYRAGRVEAQYLSLVGTIRNCAGGVTPWGSWLTCEEDVSRAGSGLERDHGWVFEVPAGRRGLTEPLPLTAMGRFYHEAATIDPRTGIAYLTEDRQNGIFYRFLPERRRDLHHGGRLQALAFADRDQPADARNTGGVILPVQAWQPVRWVDLDEVESPEDDLRVRGHAGGAVLFARGEGIHFAGGDLYFCCTSGGAAGLGQIMRYRPSRFEGRPDEARAPGQVQIFLESADPEAFNYGDNLTMAPTGHLIVCEDQYADPPHNYLRGITPDGAVYPFALLRENTELAGACFSPDGATMFVNIYHPGRTVAITGPWRAFA